MNKRQALFPVAAVIALAASGCTSTPPEPGKLDMLGAKSATERVVDVRTRGAECITPERVRTFRGDSYCDTLHPVWGEAGIHGAITREDIRGIAFDEYGDGKFRSRHVATYTAEKVGARGGVVGAGPSAYDELLSAWQRYCDAGRGMTDRDWALIEGREIPDGLKADCVVPK